MFLAEQGGHLECSSMESLGFVWVRNVRYLKMSSLKTGGIKCDFPPRFLTVCSMFHVYALQMETLINFASSGIHPKRK